MKPIGPGRWLRGGTLATVLISILARATPTAAGVFGTPSARTPKKLELNPSSSEENLTVYGQRRHFTLAPTTEQHRHVYGEGQDDIRDTMTGADLSAFGNAYNLVSVMGSDERSNETGGPYVAPIHN